MFKPLTFLLFTLTLLPQVALARDVALTWQPGDKGQTKTQAWTRDDGDWRLASTLNSPHFVADGTVWQLSSDSVNIPYTNCSCVVAAYAAHGGMPDWDSPVPKNCRHIAKINIPVAQQLGGKRRIRLTAPPQDVTGEDGESDPNYQVLGVVGSQVVVATHAYQMTCGAAHGGLASTIAVTDLHTGKPAQPWTAAEAGQASAAGRSAAIANLIKAQKLKNAKELSELKGAKFRLSALRIAWRGGHLTPSWLLTTEACYACSDGIWGSYSWSTWVNVLVPTPKNFSLFDVLPAPLSRLSSRVPDAMAIGLVPAEQAASVLQPVGRTQQNDRARGK